MSKKQKKMLARILIAAALMIGLHFVPAGGMARFILYLVPYLIIGYDILLKAFKGVKNRQPFDESLLMAFDNFTIVDSLRCSCPIGRDES